MNFVFQRIKSTPTGELATSGRGVERAFNENFDLTRTGLEALFNIASVQVSSEDITQLKLDTSVTPSLFYYSTDGLDVPEPTWTLLTTSFSKLVGDPEDNIALKGQLDSKASKLIVDELDAISKTHGTLITDLDTLTQSQEGRVGVLESEVGTIQEDLGKVVTTVDGSKLMLRYEVMQELVEFSIDDGLTWRNLTVVGVDWENIFGLPESNLLLTERINDLIHDATTILATREQLSEHTENMNNPHGVTKDDIGLDKVDNISLAGVLDNVATFSSTNLNSYLEEEEFFGFAVIGSSFLDLPIGTFVIVAELEESDTYTGPDGLVIMFYTEKGTLPNYYSLDDQFKESEGKVVIYFNQKLYEMSGGE